MYGRKMTNQIALEFDGWKNAGLETNGPNEIHRDICCIQVISIVLYLHANMQIFMRRVC